MTGQKKMPFIDVRPWGWFEQFTLNQKTTVKIISVARGEMTSSQSHEKRSEFWRVLRGEFDITIGNTIHRAYRGDRFEVPVGAIHRIVGIGEDNELLEISSGEFDENDIIRYEDKYARTNDNS